MPLTWPLESFLPRTDRVSIIAVLRVTPVDLSAFLSLSCICSGGNFNLFLFMLLNRFCLSKNTITIWAKAPPLFSHLKWWSKFTGASLLEQVY
jgi:hypothetical protein